MSNLMNTESGLTGRTARNPVGFLEWDPFRSLFGGWNAVSAVEVTRDDKGYRVDVPVAGFGPNDIEVSYEDGVLTVSGKSEKRNFTRTFAVPEDVDPDGIHAVVAHGMLTLTLTLHPKAQPKKIAVN
ncbi:MAG: Hsp20/alpha crystallin family protein [Vulcanimicrobiaceae bacterium]